MHWFQKNKIQWYLTCIIWNNFFKCGCQQQFLFCKIPSKYEILLEGCNHFKGFFSIFWKKSLKEHWFSIFRAPWLPNNYKITIFKLSSLSYNQIQFKSSYGWLLVQLHQKMKKNPTHPSGHSILEMPYKGKIVG
jgi:hypothetical protein